MFDIMCPEDLFPVFQTAVVDKETRVNPFKKNWIWII